MARYKALSIVSVLLLFAAWSTLAWAVGSPYLPAPLSVLSSLLNSFVKRDFLGFYLYQHAISSLVRIFYGFTLALLIAIPLGLLSGWLKHVEEAASPIIELLRPIPPLAWIPFAIFFFGEPFDAVFIVFLGALFPILLSTMSGVKAIDPLLVDAARTLGAKNLQLFTKVVIPASLHSIATGMRIGLGVSWMSIVAAEMVGVRGGGLGFYIWTMGEIGRFDNVFAGMIVIGLVGWAMIRAMGYLEQRLSAWRGVIYVKA